MQEKKRERDGERAGKGRCTGCTSEELAEARSGGASREAGVTLASLGLSLVNNFRMVEEEWGTKGDWDGQKEESRNGGRWTRPDVGSHLGAKSRQRWK